MATLSKKEILAADDLGSEVVTVEEWGGEVIVREMTGQERSDWESEMFSKKPKSTKEKDILETADMSYAREKLLVRCLVDEAGQHLFTVKELGELAKKSAAVLNYLYGKAATLNGIGIKEEEAAIKN